MFGIGMPELLLIVLIVLLLFGAKKIPEFMRGLGQGVKSFKDGMKDDTKESSSDKKTETNQTDNKAED